LFKKLFGILAFVAVLFSMPLGHAFMIIIEHVFGEVYKFPFAFLLGLIGFFLLLIGMKKESETTATWLGFFAGILMWTGWVEFSFVYYASHLGIPPEMVNGEVVTKPEYLLLPSSIGLMLSAVVFMFFDGNTRCRFFLWFRRLFKMPRTSTLDKSQRKYARITAMETIYVLWAFYVLLMIAYDSKIFGDTHWFTYLVFFGSFLWGGYLFIRLLKLRKMGAAVRYAIPTVIIFWNSIEILGRWGFFEEIWIEPLDHVLEMSLILLAFIGILVLTFVTQRQNTYE